LQRREGAEKALNGKLFAFIASSWRFSILLKSQFRASANPLVLCYLL
jgi:hypothetical protein